MSIDLIDHKTWMDQTSLFGRIRSAELKRVDDALAAHARTKSEETLKRVRQTFEAWKLKQGVGWRNSGRNANRTMDKLEDLLNPRASTPYLRDLAHSRKGLLYLFANTAIDIGAVDTAKLLLEGAGELVKGAVDLPGSTLTKKAADITGKSLKATTVATTVTAKVIEQIKSSKSSGSGPPTPFLTKIEQYFKKYTLKLWEYIKSKAKDFWMKPGWEKGVDIWNLVSKVAKVIVGQVAKAATPFLGGAIDIVNGIGSTVQACYHRYKAYNLGKGVDLNAGHPGAIAESIKRAMDLTIGKGLYATFKGAADITAAAFTGGASAIIMFVVAGCEILAKLIHRIWEIVGMRAFFSAAKERYAKGEAAYADASDFTAWYRSCASSLPCLSALAINSGITGDKMMYINMFKDRGEREVIGQATFNQGVEYLDRLKDWARNYLVEAGYAFHSSDPLVTAILGSTLSKKKPVLTELQLA